MNLGIEGSVGCMEGSQEGRNLRVVFEGARGGQVHYFSTGRVDNFFSEGRREGIGA